MYLFITLFVFISQVILVKTLELERLKIQMNISVFDDGTSECYVQNKHVIKEGTMVQFVINSTEYIGYAWKTFTHRHDNKRATVEVLTGGHTPIVTEEEFQIKPNFDGYWRFKILNHKNSNTQVIERYKGEDYTVTYCIIDMKVIPFSGFQKSNMSGVEMYIYFGGGITLVILFLVVIQTSIIMYYKSKARRADIHRNLSVRRKVNDEERYSVSFARKPPKDNGHYETLEEMNMQRTEPPEPPAITTIPRKIDIDAECSEVQRLRNRPQQPLPAEEYEEIRSDHCEPEFTRPGRGNPGKMRRNEAIPPDIPNTKRNIPQNTPVPGGYTLMSPVTPQQQQGLNPMAAELNKILHQKQGPSNPRPHENPGVSPITTTNRPRRIKPQARPPLTNENNLHESVFMKPLPPPPIEKFKAYPSPVPTHSDDPNSSDEEWTYEPLQNIHIYNV